MRNNQIQVASNKYLVTRDRREAGQSIIETVVAIFVLTVGITAALGLASYSLGASTNITKQIMGAGIAREGLEAIKNMRDTNWLKGTKSVDCYDFASSPVGQLTANCFKDWQNPAGGLGYNIDSTTSGQTYKLDFDRTKVLASEKPWTLVVENANFGLDRDGNALSTDPNLVASGRFYFPTTGSPTSDFSRRITITEQNTQAPYDQADIGPRLLVRSDVWWKDKKCPTVATYELANTSCRITLQMYLSNWRVY